MPDTTDDTTPATIFELGLADAINWIETLTLAEFLALVEDTQ